MGPLLLRFFQKTESDRIAQSQKRPHSTHFQPPPNLKVQFLQHFVAPTNSLLVLCSTVPRNAFRSSVAVR